jgi:hypothetical protein
MSDIEKVNLTPDIEMITIPKKEYNSLCEDSKWLTCLEGAGVDNWSGYDYAAELFHEVDD